MTNEEAIKIIRKYECNKEHYDACEMAIKALEQQPCEDCISRHDALNCITGNEVRYRMVNDIRALPAVTPKEKTGKWIKEDMLGGDATYYRCSECNELFRIENGTPKDNKYNFCPNCGARMVSE